MKELTIKITPLLLLALLVFKVAAIHSYTHDDTSDTIESCDTCMLTFTSEETKYIFTPSISVLNAAPSFANYPLLIKGYLSSLISTTTPIHLFSRPPPANV